MRRTLLLVLLTLSLVGVAQAETVATHLGDEGQLYRLLSGLYGDLVAEGTEADPDHHVLMLEIVHDDGSAELRLVPETDNPTVEKTPTLALDTATSTVFLVWEARATIHSILALAGYRDGEWVGPMEFGSAFTMKENPRLTITHDGIWAEGPEGELVEEERSVMHLVWWDGIVDGGMVLYEPMTVHDGTYYALPPIALDQLVPEDLPVSEVAPTEELLRSVHVQSRHGGRSTAIAFTHQASGRLVTLRIDGSGGDLDSFADEARAQIIILGSQASSPESFAEQVLTATLEASQGRIDATLADYLALRLVDDLLAADLSGDLEAVGNDARAQIIILGHSLRRGPQSASGDARAQIIILGSQAPGSSPSSLVLEVASHRPAPPVPEGRAIRTFVSADAARVIVAWAEEDGVRYFESKGEAWSSENGIALDEEIDHERAFAILEQRSRL